MASLTSPNSAGSIPLRRRCSRPVKSLLRLGSFADGLIDDRALSTANFAARAAVRDAQADDASDLGPIAAAESAGWASTKLSASLAADQCKSIASSATRAFAASLATPPKPGQAKPVLSRKERRFEESFAHQAVTGAALRSIFKKHLAPEVLLPNICSDVDEPEDICPPAP